MGQPLRKQGRQTEASRKPANKEKRNVVSQALKAHHQEEAFLRELGEFHSGSFSSSWPSA